jgi:hypothetical protein
VPSKIPRAVIQRRLCEVLRGRAWDRALRRAAESGLPVQYEAQTFQPSARWTR